MNRLYSASNIAFLHDLERGRRGRNGRTSQQYLRLQARQIKIQGYIRKPEQHSGKSCSELYKKARLSGVSPCFSRYS